MIGYILAALIAALHIYILVLQMFLWDKPAGRRAFGLSADFAKASKVIAANQGLYNGFLASGLAFGLLNGEEGRTFILFFLTCIIVAGLFGGMTASRKIFFIQALPAAIALAAVLAGI